MAKKEMTLLVKINYKEIKIRLIFELLAVVRYLQLKDVYKNINS